jgi:hypothetical protein
MRQANGGGVTAMAMANVRQEAIERHVRNGDGNGKRSARGDRMACA